MSFSNPLFKRLGAVFIHDHVTPLPGSIIYRKLGPAEHTGVYVGQQRIVQLSGDGRIRRVDFEEFRGINFTNQLYVACDKKGNVLHNARIAERALSKVGQSRAYNVILDNCHQFCAGCITGSSDNPNNYFWLLEYELEKHFGTSVDWRYVAGQ
jgi:hypothetical protein